MKKVPKTREPDALKRLSGPRLDHTGIKGTRNLDTRKLQMDFQQKNDLTGSLYFKETAWLQNEEWIVTTRFY